MFGIYPYLLVPVEARRTETMQQQQRLPAAGELAIEIDSIDIEVGHTHFLPDS
jgi:hypothetical protein